MAFTGDGRKLTGNDGTVYSAAIGAEITTGTLDPGIYLVSGVGGTSGFPSAGTGEGIRVGDVLRVRDADTITLGTGDAVKPLTLISKFLMLTFLSFFTLVKVGVFWDGSVATRSGSVSFSSATLFSS